MLQKRFEEVQKAFQSAIYTNGKGESLAEARAVFVASQKLLSCRSDLRTVYVIGNGGSAGIASHFSVDLMKALKIPSMTLFDSNLMTCLSNDFGYEHVFSYPLQRVARPKDILVAISSSGASENILQAVQVAKQKGLFVMTLSGFAEGNPLRSMGELNLWIDRKDYGLVEMAHFCFLHCLVDLCCSQPEGIKVYAKTIRASCSK